MATQRMWWGTTLAAADRFSDIAGGTGHLFKAVAVDGTFANDGEEAYGIIQSLANSGEHVTVAWLGEMKYTAGGGSISAGARLSVATSGYLTAAGSGDYVVGRNAENSVASGAIGRALLNFSAPFLFQNSATVTAENLVEFAAAADLTVAEGIGKGVHSNSGDFGLQEGGHADGVLVTGALSGDTAVMQIDGVVQVRAGDAILQGVSLTMEDSGYFVTAGINKNIWGRALAASAAGNSGGLFSAMISFANPQLSAVVSDAIVD